MASCRSGVSFDGRPMRHSGIVKLWNTRVRLSHLMPDSWRVRGFTAAVPPTSDRNNACEGDHPPTSSGTFSTPCDNLTVPPVLAPRHGQMEGQGGFARAALLADKRNNLHSRPFRSVYVLMTYHQYSIISIQYYINTALLHDDFRPFFFLRRLPFPFPDAEPDPGSLLGLYPCQPTIGRYWPLLKAYCVHVMPGCWLSTGPANQPRGARGDSPPSLLFFARADYIRLKND